MTTNKTLLWCLMGSAIILWPSCIWLIAALGVLADSYDEDNDYSDAYAAFSIAITLTLMMALYCTYMAVKVNKAKNVDMPMGRSTRKHSLILIIAGAIFLSWSIAGFAILVSAEQYPGVGSYVINVFCALLMVYAGTLFRKQYRSSLHPPMNINNVQQQSTGYFGAQGVKPAYNQGPVVPTVAYAAPPVTPMQPVQPVEQMMYQPPTPVSAYVQPQSTGWSTSASEEPARNAKSTPAAAPAVSSRLAAPFSPIA